MSCIPGYSGNNDSAVSINGVLYPNESFQPGARSYNTSTSQNNGDKFECVTLHSMKQDPLKVTSYLVENDWETLEALFQSKEIVPVITQTQVSVLSGTPVFRREEYDGQILNLTHSPVANADLFKLDYEVQPKSLVEVTMTTDNLLD